MRRRSAASKTRARTCGPPPGQSSAAARTGKASRTSTAVPRRVPHEDRHAEHRHAGSARMQMMVVSEVDRTEDRAEAGEGQTHDPHVGADARRADGVGERAVGEPAEVGRTLRVQEAADRDQRAEQAQPVGEHVQTREGDVGGTDLERHDPVREAFANGGVANISSMIVPCIVNAWLNCSLDMICVPGRASSARMKSAIRPPMREERERRDQIQRADGLVVSGGEPLDHGRTGALGLPAARSRTSRQPRRHPEVR